MAARLASSVPFTSPRSPVQAGAPRRAIPRALGWPHHIQCGVRLAGVIQTVGAGRPWAAGLKTGGLRIPAAGGDGKDYLVFCGKRQTNGETAGEAGRRTGRRFRLGDKVRAVVVRVDLQRRQPEFRVADSRREEESRRRRKRRD